MTTQLRWHVGLGSAWLYAAERERCFLDGLAREGAERQEAVLAERDPSRSEFSAKVSELAEFLTIENVDVDSFLTCLASLAPSIDARRELAHTALTKLYGRARADALAPPGAGAGLSGLLGACERTYAACQPKLLEELRLRTGPLRELWEARGPGLLAGVGRRTDRSQIVESATVALVPPLSGSGGGEAYASTNVVRFEAVLANPNGRLPETVRLAWLLSQLAADQLGEIPFEKSWGAALVGAAMLPAVLEAAADLELVAPDDPTLIAAAVEAWDIELLKPPGRLAALDDWRITCATIDGLPWTVRLLALETMLAGP